MSKVLNFHKTGSSPLEFRSKAANAEIDIFGPIGDSWFEDSVTLKGFREEMKKLPENTKNITVNINSPGGDVFTGIAIYNLLKQHPAKITVKVQALAASIASIIALAGDEVEMAEGSLFMIHLPMTFGFGNRKEFDSTIDRLLDVEEQLISIYVKKTKKTRAEIKSMLEKETWLDSAEAVEQGFADKNQEEAMPIAASVLSKATWLNKIPAGIKTRDMAARKEATDLKNRIKTFIARK